MYLYLKVKRKSRRAANTRLCALATLHFDSFSHCDKSPMPIASVVMYNAKKKAQFLFRLHALLIAFPFDK